MCLSFAISLSYIHDLSVNRGSPVSFLFLLIIIGMNSLNILYVIEICDSFYLLASGKTSFFTIC